MNRACATLCYFLEFLLACKLWARTFRGDKGMISRRPHVSSEAPGPGLRPSAVEPPSYRDLTAWLTPCPSGPGGLWSGVRW